jgi:hypothetical protein
MNLTGDEEQAYVVSCRSAARIVDRMMGAAEDVVIYGVPQLGRKAEKREMRSF